jgi:AsmA protein
VRFMVQGPWDDPIILPDPQSRIQRSGAAQPILDAVRKLGAGDSVRSAIERLTGVTSDPSAPSTAAPNLTGNSAPVESAPAIETAEPLQDAPRSAQ